MHHPILDQQTKTEHYKEETEAEVKAVSSHVTAGSPRPPVNQEKNHNAMIIKLAIELRCILDPILFPLALHFQCWKTLAEYVI